MSKIVIDRAVVEGALSDVCAARLCEVNSMSSRQEMLRLMIRATDALRAALEQEERPELRELLIGAAAMAVAAERKGAYQGASWVADAVLEQEEQTEQEEREPAAWLTEDGDRVVTQKTKSQMLRDGGAASSSMTPYCVPAFTTTPHREWRGLTDAEIDALLLTTSGSVIPFYRAMSRAVEAALKERNHG